MENGDVIDASRYHDFGTHFSRRHQASVVDNDVCWIDSLAPDHFVLADISQKPCDSLVSGFPLLGLQGDDVHLYYSVDVCKYKSHGGSFVLDTGVIQQFDFNNGICSELPGFFAVESNDTSLAMEDVLTFSGEAGWVFSDYPGASLFTGTAIVIGEERLREGHQVPACSEPGLVVLVVLIGVLAFVAHNRRGRFPARRTFG